MHYRSLYNTKQKLREDMPPRAHFVALRVRPSPVSTVALTVACVLLALLAAASPTFAAVSEARVPPGFEAHTFASGLKSPRRVVVNPINGDALILERGASRVTAMWRDSNGELQKAVLISDFVAGVADSLFLHVPSVSADGTVADVAAFGSSFLFTSSPTAVYRWHFDPAAPRASLDGKGVLVVKNIPRGGHSTRALMMDRASPPHLYVTVGSGSNVDEDSSRARMYRFADMTATIRTNADAVDFFAGGSLVAKGLRNEAGLAADLSGVGG
jgi:glucose/arabinose dehydrogenase